MSDQLADDALTLETPPDDSHTDAGATTTRAKAPARRSGRSKGRSPGRTSRASVRRIAEKAEELVDTDGSTRQLVADLTGAGSTGIADLTTAIMEAKRTPVDAAVADLTIIQDGSIPEAVVHLVGMSKDELKSLHQLVSTFSDVDLPEKIPAKSTDAALVLVDPVRSAQIDEAAVDRLVQLLAK